MLAGAVVAGAVLAGVPRDARAELDDFAGRWTGESIVASTAAAELGLVPEDLAFEIVEERNGFRFRGTRIIRPEDRLGSTSLVRSGLDVGFDEADAEGVFESESSADPLEREPLIWARLAGNQLSLYYAVINATGGFTIHQWDWTETEPGRLSVRVTFVADEHEVVAVEGTLVPAGGGR